MNKLDKRFDFIKKEPEIYTNWEKQGLFKPEVNPKGKAFSIILPPPNANGDLHLGHAMYTVEDIMIRYHRMLGDATLWLPGADHAGFETQFVYEKKLKKEGKSRFDFSQKEFYDNVLKFVLSNRKNMQNQLRSLGFSLDWSRDKFTLDKDIIDTVYDTFIKLYKKNLIYKGERVGNYCVYCGTAFSDLEIKHKEVPGKLWYIKYPLVDSKDYITVATTRPETMLGDTAVAVNPKDKKYKNLIGKKIKLPLANREIPIIADLLVDPKFGTGAVKVTPAHSEVDYEIYLRNKTIGIIPVINKRGKINENAPKKYQGLKALQAREEIIKDLTDQKMLEKITDHMHNVGHCYKCGRIIEPLPLPQWFLKMKELAKPAIKAVKEKQVQFIPKRFEKIYFNWMRDIRDWPISRQLWFGIRMPIYYCQKCNEIIVSKTKPKHCHKCKSNQLTQESDTFDTWFSSGQWPYATLKNTKTGDFEKFYPTSVMETSYDIIFFWVARMIMFGLYTTKKVPFRYVYFHGLVRDKHGVKMSKSKGNVINPSEIIQKYGTDALRFSLIADNAPGGDQSISEEKIRGYRNFITKIYNGARFVMMQLDDYQPTILNPAQLNQDDLKHLKKLNQNIEEITKKIDKFQFGLAANQIYEYFWHEFCDVCIEQLKDRVYKPVSSEDQLSAKYTLYTILKNSLKLLHPFVPYVTEEIWQSLPKTSQDSKHLITAKWPNKLNF